MNKIIIRDTSSISLLNTNLNLLKIVLIADLKNHLMRTHKMPPALLKAYDMEIIENLLLKVETWMSVKMAKMGIDSFNEWVSSTL